MQLLVTFCAGADIRERETYDPADGQETISAEKGFRVLPVGVGADR